MRSLWVLTVTALALGTAALAGAQSAPLEALDGLDPVLLVQGKEVAGKPDLTVVRGRFTYAFSSAATKATFESAPDRFEIQMNGVCARMGPMAGGNPSDFFVYEGRIYIFGSDECHKRFAAAPARFMPPTPAAMPSGDKAVAAGRALVDCVVTAMGGATHLDSLTSYVESWTATQKTAQGDVTVPSRMAWRFPDAVRIERTMTRADKTQTTARVMAGGAAWFDGGPGRIFPMLPDAVTELERANGWHLVPLLRARTSGTFEAAALGPAAMAGASVERMRVRRGPVDVTLGVDAASGEIRALSFVGRNGEGEFGTYEIAFSDYRPVNGLRLPFKERALFDGAPDESLQRTLDAIALDVVLDPSLFTRADGSGSVKAAMAGAGLFALALGARVGPLSPAWPQWGGPTRNFVVASADLATSWPADGPRRLWRRPLGDGFSAIVTDGATLYSLYRDGVSDVVVALDARTGATQWESRYEAPFNDTCSQQLGPAPRASPLVIGDQLITASAGGLMHAFQRRTGALQWTHDLLAGTPDAVRACGYSSSPLAYKGRVITTAGGSRRGVIALEAETGHVRWQSQDFENGYSSPLVIDLDGKPELVVFTFGEVAGLDPDTGALDWRVPHPADFGVNVAMPVWGDDHLLFVSSAYNGGSRALHLARRDGAVVVEERWASKRVRIHFGNAVRLGDRVYASNGDFGAAPLSAIDVTSGEIVWRDRSLARSTLIGAGDRLLLLDEDGTLALAIPGETGLTVLARASVLESQTWTPPTLSGTTVYVRNRRDIVALDLGAAANTGR